MSVFDTLHYWQDDLARKGAENMAVDQLLLERIGKYPILRVYRWSEPTVSFGYFLGLRDARAAFPSTATCPLSYVRRWTGGGVVDHRSDVTYTLVIPRTCALANKRGAASYRVIHQLLAETLKKLGEHVVFTAVDQGDGGPACFSNPVEYDLTDVQGGKVAGAGQRRTRNGLLHQGSLVTGIDAGVLGMELAASLAGSTNVWSPDMSLHAFEKEVAELAAGRYASEAWLTKK